MGSARPSCPVAPLTAPLCTTQPLPSYPDGELCPACLTAVGGLCGRDDCRRQVLPQLAINGGWLKLIGDARIEQSKRQRPVPTEKVQLDRIARRNARKVARSSRRGYFGLAKAIATAK